MFVALFASVLPACGMAVNWSSEFFAPHVQSTGQKLGGQFSFALGCFNQGFTPTATNTREWSSYWIELGRTGFNAEEASFCATTDSESPEFPAELKSLNGVQVFVWGMNGMNPADGVEWFLATDASWVWQAGQGAAAVPATYVVTNANQVVLGRVDRADGHLETAYVGPERQSPQAWLAACFSDVKAPKAQWNGDADGDGAANIMEFALGTDPNDPGSVAAPSVRLTEDGRLRLELAKNPSAAVRVTVESSTDLEKWVTDAPGIVTLEETGSWVTVEQDSKVGRGASLYFRARASFAK